MGYIARPARVRVRLDGGLALEYRVENSQARLFVRALQAYREAIEAELGPIQDSDMVDALLALVGSELRVYAEQEANDG